MNIEKSRQRQDAVCHIQDDITQLVNDLKGRIGVRDIRFDGVWGIQHFRGCLMTFNRLYNDHKEFLEFSLQGMVNYL